MRRCSVGITAIVAGVMIVLISGCGQETANVPDTTPPQVTSTTPASGATAVTLSTAISATFSKTLNAASINSGSFTVAGPGGVAVTGSVTYTASGSVATFTPAANFAYGTTYTATITTHVTDTANPANALAANYVWSFSTGAAPVPPTVISVVPVNGATVVPINQGLTATFSEAMNSASISGTTFTVTGPGGVSVPGNISYAGSGSVATFIPTANFAGGAAYTATITTGATNTAGTALVANYVWNFTTISAAPAVISTIPVNGATGVPVNQSLTATFSEAMKCSTLASPATTFTVAGPGATPVAGTVSCSGAVAAFTPGNNLATNTLYTATITTGAASAAGIATSGNYVWSFLTGPAPTPPTLISTTPANGATGVPVNQALTATFSVAMTPTTIDTATFIVTGPGGTAVTGEVTYAPAGSVAIFTPATNLASSTVYTATITTGARDVQGAALAANYVWTFTTAAAPVTTLPTVISTNPANAAVDVPFNQVISATFSEPMNPATINSGTFTLTGPGGTAVTGLVAYATIGNTLTFIPTADLAASSVYAATITTGAQDLAGDALAANYVWTFTTGAAPATIPPTVVLTAPVNAAANAPTNQAVSATFSEAMNPLTITTATFQLTGPAGTAIAGTVAYDAINFIATLTPTARLTGSTTYTAIVTTGATDLAGNPLASGSVPNPWTFTTGAVVVLPPVNLGTAALFGGFGGDAGITNQGVFTLVNGDIGTTAVSTLITGFNDNTPGCIYTETPLNIGLVNGSIDTAPPPPAVACPTEGTAVTGAIAAQAALDALTAYNALVAFPNGLDVSTCPGCGGGSAGELGNRTLAPGIYKSAPGSYAITAGVLTLDAQGDPNAFWVFQMATTLTVGTPVANESVLLVNGARAKNVYWQVGTAATINGVLGGGTMAGTIIAQAGVSISTAGVAAATTLNGRALVLTGPVTMVNTVINVPAP